MLRKNWKGSVWETGFMSLDSICPYGRSAGDKGDGRVVPKRPGIHRYPKRLWTDHLLSSEERGGSWRIEAHSGFYYGKVSRGKALWLNGTHFCPEGQHLPHPTQQWSYGRKGSEMDMAHHGRHQGSSYPHPVWDEAMLPRNPDHEGMHLTSENGGFWRR